MTTDDPKFTAYVLDELPPAERLELEAELTRDAAGQAEVEELRALAQRLRAELAEEGPLELTAEQRAAMLQAAAEAAPGGMVARKMVTPMNRAVWVPSALAACLAVGLGVWFFGPGTREAAQHGEKAASLPRDEGVPMTFSVDAERPSPVPANEAEPAIPAPALAPGLAQKATALSAPVPGAAPAPGALSLSAGKGALPAGDLASERMAAKMRPMESVPASGGGVAALAEKQAAPRMMGRADRKQAGASANGEVASAMAKSVPTDGAALNMAPAAPTAAAAAPVEEPAKAAVPRSALRSAPSPAAQSASDLSAPKLDTITANSPAPFSAPKSPASSMAGRAGGMARAGKDKDAARQEMAGELTQLRQQMETQMKLQALTPVEAERDRFAKDLKKEQPADEPSTRRSRTNHFREQLGPDEPAAGGEAYISREDNPFVAVRDQPLSTFSIDVDTASYTNVRRMIQGGTRPPRDAVRIEEMMNFFTYDYPPAPADAPCSVNLEVAGCPWTPEHRLVRVGLKAREVAAAKRPPANLVFLLDVSGSMEPENRLPLARQSLRLLTDQLGPEDRVSIVVYAGNSGVVLEPTSDKSKIREALNRLQAGGSTNGAAGIQQAYELARRGFAKGQINRVILATDGDFNVGMTDRGDLTDLIKREAKSGVFLTVLGFGYGNLKDATLEKLADSGNGNHAYISDLAEGRRVLVEQMGGTLQTVAKDVKIQVEFNPAKVSGYRLIGYEKRLLQARDFNDDTKDAGEMGSGHTVTALYEIVPAGGQFPGTAPMEKLKYQANAASGAAADREAAKASVVAGNGADAKETLTLKLRWKEPEAEESQVREFPLTDEDRPWAKSSVDFRWAASVAGFGMLLRDSAHAGNATWGSVKELANEGKGADKGGYRQEMISLIDQAKGARR